MASEGIQPHATSTWPGAVLRKRLQAKAASLRSNDRMKAVGIVQAGDPDPGPSPSRSTCPPTQARPASLGPLRIEVAASRPASPGSYAPALARPPVG
ncbi:hypothetical protein [Nonomuraea sp. NPDC050786]|uniref:hypothetical protein n=1 Tax=Nonomuraea sp. NPDC050786 TaxID=3154840 RepID=UPI0033EDA552